MGNSFAEQILRCPYVGVRAGIRELLKRDFYVRLLLYY